MSVGKPDSAQLLQQFDELMADARRRRHRTEYAALRLRIVYTITFLLTVVGVVVFSMVREFVVGEDRVTATMFVALWRDFWQEFNLNPAFRLVVLGLLVLVSLGVHIFWLRRSIRQLRQLSARDEASFGSQQTGAPR